MASPTIETVDRTDEVIDAFEEGIDEMIKSVHEEAVKEIVTNMPKGRDALGNPWQPLEDDEGVPLVDSGKMITSIPASSTVITSAPNAAVGIFAVDTDYAKYHEFGAPDAGVPARPFILPGLAYATKELPNALVEEVDTRVQDALIEI